MPQHVICLTFVYVLLVLIVPFWLAFALKVAYLEHLRRKAKPGGFEVKLAEKPTGGIPVLEKEEDDHG
jgi:hypothetical protein